MENATVELNSFWYFKGAVDYVDEWFLMSSPLTVLTVCIVYLSFVLKIGPDFMKNTQPFHLKYVLIVHNATQVIVSSYVTYLGTKYLIEKGLIQQRECLQEREDLRRIASGMYCYFLAKTAELLDTVFFVLRKRNRQVTFLHVYHHSTMLLCSWFTLKYEPSHSTVFIGTINSFVHVAMYTYYGLAAYPDLAKYLWWKKYITSMQLVQFVLIILQAVVNYKVTSCPPSYVLLAAVLWNAILFAVLFTDFYIKSYTKKNTETSTGKESNSEISDINKNGTFFKGKSTKLKLR